MIYRIGMSVLIITLTLSLCSICCVTAEQESTSWVPEIQDQSVPVQDLTGKINEQDKKLLNEKLIQFTKTTNISFVVLLTNSLREQPLENFANQTFRKWKIGTKDPQTGKIHDGLLLVVSIQDRKTRLEVGYYTEQFITDGMAGECIRMGRESFQKGDFGAGIINVTDEVIKKVGTKPLEERIRELQRQLEYERDLAIKEAEEDAIRNAKIKFRLIWFGFWILLISSIALIFRMIFNYLTNWRERNRLVEEFTSSLKNTESKLTQYFENNKGTFTGDENSGPFSQFNQMYSNGLNSIKEQRSLLINLAKQSPSKKLIRELSWLKISGHELEEMETFTRKYQNIVNEFPLRVANTRKNLIKTQTNLKTILNLGFNKVQFGDKVFLPVTVLLEQAENIFPADATEADKLVTEALNKLQIIAQIELTPYNVYVEVTSKLEQTKQTLTSLMPNQDLFKSVIEAHNNLVGLVDKDTLIGIVGEFDGDFIRSWQKKIDSFSKDLAKVTELNTPGSYQHQQARQLLKTLMESLDDYYRLFLGIIDSSKTQQTCKKAVTDQSSNGLMAKLLKLTNNILEETDHDDVSQETKDRAKVLKTSLDKLKSGLNAKQNWVKTQTSLTSMNTDLTNIRDLADSEKNAAERRRNRNESRIDESSISSPTSSFSSSSNSEDDRPSGGNSWSGFSGGSSGGGGASDSW